MLNVTAANMRPGAMRDMVAKLEALQEQLSRFDRAVQTLADVDLVVPAHTLAWRVKQVTEISATKAALRVYQMACTHARQVDESRHGSPRYYCYDCGRID